MASVRPPRGSPFRVYEAFTKAAQSGVPTVYLSFSSGLSGSYDVSHIVAEQVKEQYPGMELHIVDTKLASVAEALLVYEAIRQREKGLTAHEMVAWAEEARYFVNALFMVDDLESLRRGGRIPDSVAYAGAKLDVKPLLTIDLEGNFPSKALCAAERKELAGCRILSRPSRPGESVPARGNRPRRLPERPRAPARHRLKADEGVLFMDGEIGRLSAAMSVRA
ncbi:MAG: DegV family protein [Slackia sp.]